MRQNKVSEVNILVTSVSVPGPATAMFIIVTLSVAYSDSLSSYQVIVIRIIKIKTKVKYAWWCLPPCIINISRLVLTSINLFVDIDKVSTLDFK